MAAHARVVVAGIDADAGFARVTGVYVPPCRQCTCNSVGSAACGVRRAANPTEEDPKAHTTRQVEEGG